MTFINSRLLGIQCGFQMIGHPAKGIWIHDFESDEADAKKFSKPSLWGASLRKEYGEFLVYRLHWRFPVWFPLKDAKYPEGIYPVMTWTFIKVVKRLHQADTHAVQKMWELGRGSGV